MSDQSDRNRAISRRRFLRLGAGASGAALASGPLSALGWEGPDGEVELLGVLVDTTRCIGCRQCEKACATTNGWPVPNLTDTSVLATPRTTRTDAWTVVNRFETSRGQVFVKRQCMHCNQPACATACLVKAMLKKTRGPVVWREDKCMGCRYCMVSCPYDMPKFEYDRAVPKIQKCHLCCPRLEKGGIPACVEACPTQALAIGTRREMLLEARARMAANPERYHRGVYGESEVGGSTWMYLSAVPFQEIGFRIDLGTTPSPEYTTGFLFGVPFVFVLWPGLLLGMNRLTASKEDEHRASLAEAVDAGKKQAEKAASEGFEKGKVSVEKTSSSKIATLEKKVQELSQPAKK